MRINAIVTRAHHPSRATNGECETRLVDERTVARVAPLVPSEAHVRDVADFFAAFADPTRLRILAALAEAELCVCDVAAVLNRSVATTSRQLQLLRRTGLVTYRTSGKLAYYTLANGTARTLVTAALARLAAQTEAA